MQRAQDGSTELVPEPTSPRPGLSPAIAFALLAIVVAVIAAAVFLTRPDTEVQAAATNPTSTSPKFALTNEEAIARFEELHASLLTAYRTRDVTLLDAFLTQHSPLRRRALLEIRQLLKDRVIPKPTFETRSVELLTNENDRIIVRQVVLDTSRFQSETGSDVTRKPQSIRRVVRWTLQLDGSVWKIHDSAPLSARRVKN